MILLFSLILDVVFFIAKTVRSRKGMTALPLFAISALANSYAHYMILGLTDAFGDHLLFALICTATAKIFIFWAYLLPGEPRPKNAPVYLLTVLLSLCLHDNPVTGLLCTTFLLLFLLYTEHSENAPDKEKPIPAPGQESSLYLKTIEDSYRKNRALMHDLKNHIIVLRSFAEAKEYDKLLEYTDSLAEKVSENLFPVRSGNMVLDALLADKYHTARRNGIFVEFVSVRCDFTLDGGDLCAVIGNLFDNAIAENLKTNRPEERRISLSIRTHISDITGKELLIQIKNPLFHSLKIQNGLPASDKPDVEHHGIGLKNVRRICHKYDGSLVWDDADGIFTVTACLKMT